MSKKKISSRDPMYQREKKNYENPIASREFILSYLKVENKPISIFKLEKKFSINNKSAKFAFKKRLNAMIRDGQIMQNRANNYILVKKLKLKAATVVNNDGLAVRLENNNLYQLNPRYNNIFFPGDKVLVRTPNKISDFAIVSEVTERFHKSITGLFIEKNGVKYIKPSLRALKNDITVTKSISGVKENDYVTAEIIDYPSVKNFAFTAKVTKVLGDKNTEGVEIDVALSAHDLPVTWSDDVYKQVEKLPYNIDNKDIESRTDLRHLPFITIDGEDSKDFDDAVYANINKQGNFELYVAIADVSHYVTENSAIDKDATMRATSVYFPREVIPMLPEILSNNLCSLLPNKDRFTLVAKVELSKQSKIIKYKFFTAIINSHARLTYTQAFKMLMGTENIPQLIEASLKNLEQLYKILSKARNNRGAIDFNTQETKALFHKDGKIKKIVPYSRNIAHCIIEECMLLANNVAAKYISQNEYPTLYRVHDSPDISKITALKDFLICFSIDIPKSIEPTAEFINNVLQQVKDKECESIVTSVLLRVMSQAYYHYENIGHYGLSYDFYLHFTSPIRRYPDLVVHRAIKQILLKGKNAKPLMKKQLDYLSNHCSYAERRADYASRDVMAWLKCSFMEDKIGTEFLGIITSVTNFGFFVELDGLYIDGLVHISSLSGDYYEFDAKKHALKSKRTRKCYRIGEKVKVKLKNVDMANKFIDLTVC